MAERSKAPKQNMSLGYNCGLTVYHLLKNTIEFTIFTNKMQKFK